MINISQGESGYFSTPTNTLDPYLFESNEHLRPDVRTRLVNLLLDYLSTRYNNPDQWTRIWLAGSGISYQWSAARGNGDLDVLFGIDYDAFVNNNPFYQFDSRDEIANDIDDDLRKNLWSRTTHMSFPLTDDDLYNYKFFEVTFFLNPGVDSSYEGIMNIHPYAAYDLTSDTWTHKPEKAGSDIYRHPQVFADQADRNLEAAQALVDRYNHIRQSEGSSMPGTPQEVNYKAHKALVVNEARGLLDSIHLGRRAAFTGSGEGYGDFYNYQWQRAKADGIIRALNSIIANES